MRLPGFNPDGVAFGTIESGAVACVPPISVRRSAKQAIMRAFGAAHARATLPAADTLGAADAAGASSTSAAAASARVDRHASPAWAVQRREVFRSIELPFR